MAQNLESNRTKAFHPKNLFLFCWKNMVAGQPNVPFIPKRKACWNKSVSCFAHIAAVIMWWDVRQISVKQLYQTATVVLYFGNLRNPKSQRSYWYQWYDNSTNISYKFIQNMRVAVCDVVNQLTLGAGVKLIQHYVCCQSSSKAGSFSASVDILGLAFL